MYLFHVHVLYNGRMEVTIAFARAHMKTLLKAVAGGERVTIMNRKKPVADLVPPQPKRRAPQFGTLAHLKIDPRVFDPMTNEEVERFLETGEY